MNSQRRRLVAAGAALAFGAGAAAQPAEKVIRIVAKKFEYTPGEITLEKGVPVLLEFTTEDVAMGFNAPDFNLDLEIVPGKTVQARLVPDQAGTFEFHCDIFCGDGHEDMSGKIHVT